MPKAVVVSGGLIAPVHRRESKSRETRASGNPGQLTILSVALAACFIPLAAQADCLNGGSGSYTSNASINLIWQVGNCSISSGVSLNGGTYGLTTAASVDTLTNSGLISGGSTAFHVSNGLTVGSITNSGTITGSIAGIYNGITSTIITLTNGGTISGANYGIQSDIGSSITSLNNNGLITSSTIGIYNFGTINTLTNGGTISGTTYGIQSDNGSSITSLNNTSTGQIKGGTAVWFGNSASSSTVTAGTLTNAGSIVGTTAYGVANNTGATLGRLSNTGVITGALAGVDNAGSIGTLVNSGTISSAGYAVFNTSNGTLGPITNSGLIAGGIGNLTPRGLTINGGTGTTFGTLTGSTGSITASAIGTITSGSANLTFGSGNILLNDNIGVGNNTVSNVASTLQINNHVSITGNYNQGAGATLLVGVNDAATATGSASNTGYGILFVSGASTIAAGATIGLTKTNNYAFAVGQRYVALVTAGAANYTPSALNYSLAGFTVTGANVADGSNTNLVLTLGTIATASTAGSSPTGSSTAGSSTAATSTAVARYATTGTAISALNGLFNYTGANINLLNVFNAGAALGSTAAANSAGAQLSPAALSSATAQASAAATQTVINVAAAHIDSLRIAQADGASGISTGETDHSPAVWGQAFGGQATQNTRDGVSGYRASYGGLLMGADAPVNERWRAGGLFSFSDTSLSNNGDNAGSGGHIQSYGLTGYASYTSNPWYINLMAGAATQHTNTARTVSFTGFSGVNTGTFNSMQYTTAVQAGYPLSLDRWMPSTTLTPLVGLSYSHLRQNGYTESGSASALNVGASNSNSLRSELGAKLSRQFVTAYGTLVPSVEMDWRHQYQNTRIQSTAGFTADTTGSTTFATQSAAPIANTGVLNLGVTLLKGRNLSVSAQYVLEAGGGYTAQTGDVQVRWQY